MTLSGSWKELCALQMGVCFGRQQKKTRGYYSCGYGQFRLGSRRVYAHRIIYEHHHGPIPAGHLIHHICENRLCVENAHLAMVTPKEHLGLIHRSGEYNRIKTHCPQGHPYSGYNLIIRCDGKRDCRTCNQIRNRARSRRKRAEQKAVLAREKCRL
jgi:hypothetical protein